LCYLPTIRHKYLDTLAHTFLSTSIWCSIAPTWRSTCNAANALFTWLPRLAGVPVALNVDGIERKRKKSGNWLARTWYLASNGSPRRSECRCQRLGEDRGVLPGTLWQEHPLHSYGAETGKTAGTGVLARLGLEPGRYFLYVSRMEPENNALLVREAFEA